MAKHPLESVSVHLDNAFSEGFGMGGLGTIGRDRGNTAVFCHRGVDPWHEQTSAHEKCWVVTAPRFPVVLMDHLIFFTTDCESSEAKAIYQRFGMLSRDTQFLLTNFVYQFVSSVRLSSFQPGLQQSRENGKDEEGL